jgi:glycosyltransferase involved in cell wall biosynthesis
MAAKNEEKHISTAIQSILDQTYDRLELVVVDDYSTDKTLEVVRSFRDPRVKLYEKKSEPTGAAASRNLGVQLAEGELIAYQDADDISHPRRLELQVQEVLSGEKPRIVGSWIEERIGNKSHIKRLPTSHEEIVAGLVRLYNRVTFVSGTMLFPHNVALAVPERERFRYFEDWDQLCRLNELGTVEFRNVPEVLFIYNIRPKGSKGQIDWLRYNVFERACRARRCSGLAEWETADEFEAYLRSSPFEFLRWYALRSLLDIKLQM